MPNALENMIVNLSLLLESELQLSNKLLESLYMERSALEDFDDKLITLNTSNKHKLINELQEATNKRLAYIEQNHIDEAALSYTSLDQTSKELKRIATLCFEENQLIGQLINRRSQFIIHALNNIMPGTAANNLTYTSNGTTGAMQNFGELGIG